MGFLCVKADLLKMIESMRGIDRASHAQKNGVNFNLKDNFLGLQALTKNCSL